MAVIVCFDVVKQLAAYQCLLPINSPSQLSRKQDQWVKSSNSFKFCMQSFAFYNQRTLWKLSVHKPVLRFLFAFLLSSSQRWSSSLGIGINPMTYPYGQSNNLSEFSMSHCTKAGAEYNQREHFLQFSSILKYQSWLLQM